jgi:ACR3 family arsenite transporter
MAARKGLSIFEKYLTLWVLICIGAGIVLGKLSPDIAVSLDSMSIYQVSIPIAVCLFFMMYPIMVKIDFAKVIKAAKTPKPVAMTLLINWGIKPFTMLLFATFFLGYLFKSFIPGTEIINGEEVELWRSYVSGAILLGIAPCTAMVLMWSYLAKGNDGLTLVMVAVNSLIMLVLYAVLGGFLLDVNAMPIPWQTILLSVGIYVALPLVAGYFSRKWIIQKKGIDWFKTNFLQWLTPVSIIALLATLVLSNSPYCTNSIHFRIGLFLACPCTQAFLSRRCTGCHDRRFEPFRGGHSNRRDAVRAPVRCRAGNGRWRSNRGTPDATAGLHLHANMLPVP